MSKPRPTPETDAAICGQAEYDSYGAYLDSLEDHARKLERERDEALQWKREQMLVESQWDAQAVAKELGMLAGADIRENILPAIQKLKRERDEAREKIDAISKRAEAIRCELVASEKRSAMTKSEPFSP
jgi:NAD(P)H-dependent flavin oxidoreductase YrpB (nitropropane dioxygenase family)